MTPTLDEARAAKSKALNLLRNAPAVVGVGIARLNGGYCVKVNVSQSQRGMPTDIDGVPVRVEVVGTLRKQPAAAPRRRAARA